MGAPVWAREQVPQGGGRDGGCPMRQRDSLALAKRTPYALRRGNGAESLQLELGEG